MTYVGQKWLCELAAERYHEPHLKLLQYDIVYIAISLKTCVSHQAIQPSVLLVGSQQGVYVYITAILLLYTNGSQIAGICTVYRLHL